MDNTNLKHNETKEYLLADYFFFKSQVELGVDSQYVWYDIHYCGSEISVEVAVESAFGSWYDELEGEVLWGDSLKSSHDIDKFVSKLKKHLVNFKEEYNL